MYDISLVRRGSTINTCTLNGNTLIAIKCIHSRAIKLVIEVRNAYSHFNSEW